MDNTASGPPSGLRRAAGALLVAGIALFFFVFFDVLRFGLFAPYAITWRVIVLVLAAALLGAFAMVRDDQAGTVPQVVALSLSLVLIIASRFLGDAVLAEVSQVVVAGVGILAVLAAWIVRAL